ncbi:MAG: hypothetical protein O3A80_02660 [bacterium]|nr:hypothetical protein [bacterium]MDA1292272.1 hypothetical protein [bacterium]
MRTLKALSTGLASIALLMSVGLSEQAHAAGTIEVRSDPTNVAFEMKSLIDGSVYSGVTPMVFTNMPPVTYTVRYDIQPSCEVQKDIHRELISGSRLIFWKNFTCGDQRIPLAGRTAKRIGTDTPVKPYVKPNAHVDMPAKRIVQTSSQSEVVAGGSIRYTVSISNMTRGTLHNIDVVDRYNPEMIDIIQPLLDGGVIKENEIIWSIPELFAGQSWSTTFTARTKPHLVAGDRIVLMAHAYSDEADFDLYPEAWSSVAGVGIAYMPQTGGKYDLLFVLAALVGAAFITNLTISRKQ